MYLVKMEIKHIKFNTVEHYYFYWLIKKKFLYSSLLHLIFTINKRESAQNEYFFYDQGIAYLFSQFLINLIPKWLQLIQTVKFD